MTLFIVLNAVREWTEAKVVTKYIERDKAVKLIFLAADAGRAANALSLLGKESVADVVEVVRCKDCAGKKACEIWGIYLDDDDYCSRGARLDGGESDENCGR